MGPVNATFSMAAAHLVPLAQELDQNKVTPGLLGFVIFALIGSALWLLMKNMTKQFGKVDFEEAPDPDAEPGTGPAPEPAAAKTSHSGE
jgi:hypothetical protein